MSRPTFAALVTTVLTLAAVSSCSSDESEPLAYPGEMLWTNENGKTQDRTVVMSLAGPEHCEWQSVTFLYLGGESVAQGRKQYLRDPLRIIPAGRLATSFASAVDLPADARDTGLRRDGSALWVAPDAAYVVSPTTTERWPQTLDHGVFCL